MRKLLIAFIILSATVLCGSAQVTIEYCLGQAGKNYPLIKKYGLVQKTSDISLSDINRSWLPRLGLYGQATVQNVVPELPGMLEEVLAQAGHDMRGLGHLQYKTGIDLTQTIWDGGTSKAEREIERATAEESLASLDVQMYAVREKVIDLFFGILLMEEQIAQTNNTAGLLEANLSLMKSMYDGGVAMQSDVDMVEAQLLGVMQQLISARGTADSYRRLISLYIGENIEGKELEKPEASMPHDLRSDRPELALFDARSRVNAARNSAVETTVMPRIGFFAQAYYGYPGINYFESMMSRDLSFNVVAGVKVAWNIDSFYTRKNSRRRFALMNESIERDRDVFLFNIGLRTQSQTDAIDRLRDVMREDGKIVRLRSSVRAAAESQLKNGVIDATALLAKITDENQARLAASYHEIQLLQNIYQLKNTLNR